LTKDAPGRALSRAEFLDPLFEASGLAGHKLCTKDIDGVLWFTPEGGGREFRASIDDEQLRRRAVEYQIDHPRVRAVFDVYESLPPGDDTIIRTSRTLNNFTLAPTGEQATLDTTT
jgi:hypothetical protein